MASNEKRYEKSDFNLEIKLVKKPSDIGKCFFFLRILMELISFTFT